MPVNPERASELLGKLYVPDPDDGLEDLGIDGGDDEAEE
jgi:hypothetical protein